MRCRTANCASFLLYVFQDILDHDSLSAITPSTVLVKKNLEISLVK